MPLRFFCRSSSEFTQEFAQEQHLEFFATSCLLR